MKRNILIVLLFIHLSKGKVILFFSFLDKERIRLSKDKFALKDLFGKKNIDKQGKPLIEKCSPTDRPELKIIRKCLVHFSYWHGIIK